MKFLDRLRGLFHRTPDTGAVPKANQPKRGRDVRDAAWFLARTMPKGGNVHRKKIERNRMRRKMARATRQAQRRRAA